jgi:hypothetical protein
MDEIVRDRIPMSQARIQQESTNTPLPGVFLSATEVARLKEFAPGVLDLWRQLAEQRISDETLAEHDRIMTETLSD